MVQCPNGTQVAPGAPSSFWAGGLPFMSYLSNKLPALAAILAALFPDEIIVTSAFCATEPTLSAEPTLVDYAQALLANGPAQRKVLDYWRTSYLASVWPTYCQCTPGGTPAGSLEAFISTTYAPLNWWKYDDASLSTSAHDYGSGGQNAGMFTPYAFNTAKICPNATGTCLTTNGGGGNIGIGGASALNTRSQWSIAGFFQTTDVSHGALFSNYAGVNAFIRLAKDLVAGKLYAFIRDTGGTQGPVESTHSDFHDGNTHLFVLSIDHVNSAWHLWSDNGRDECSGTLSALSYWNDASSMYLQDDFVASLPYGGKSQNWFVTGSILGENDAKAIWFNAGLGGGPVFVPPTPAADPDLPNGPPSGFTGTDTAAVLAALSVLEQKVDNLARYTPDLNVHPIKYGTPVAGLTNSGSISATGLVGVEVTCTTIPPGWGRTTDSPARYIPQLGALQLDFGGSGPWNDAVQLHYTPQLFMFNPQDVVNVRYSLKPGVHATITPVTRGQS